MSKSGRVGLWMVGAMAPDIVAQMEPHYDIHRGWEIDDPAAYLQQHGHAIEAIVTSGRYGATAALMDLLPKLEVIVSFGVGYDPIDIPAAQARGIAVSNTPGVLDACVADAALALMLAVSRRICEADRFVRSNQWGPAEFGLGHSMASKHCGIVGMGNIGLQIARRAESFGMHILYHNRRAREDVPAHYRFVDSVLELAQQSDMLVLALPGGASTQHLVNAKVLEALGPKGYLINVARGSVVDEEALVQALQARTIAGAGLDVYEFEPQVPEALKTMEQVVVLPHIGSGTHETRQAMGDLFLLNLNTWFTDRRLVTPVV